MKNPLRIPEDYELYLYTLKEKYNSVQDSTLTFVRRGTSLARVSGELHFEHKIRLIIRERIIFDRIPDPHDQGLQSTHPHHKHVPPNMKHYRIPSPEMSFIQPNLSCLIEEIESILKELNKDT